MKLMEDFQGEIPKINEIAVEVNDKGIKLFKKAMFEFVSVLLIISLFFYEYGELLVKEQDVIIFLGNIAVMFILSMLFDGNYRIKGKLAGIGTERYQKAKESLNTKTEKLTDKDIEKINKNIEKYVEEEECKNICKRLYKVGITKEEYHKKYKHLTIKELGKERLTKLQRKGIIQAGRVRRSPLSINDLLWEYSNKNQIEKIEKNQKQLDTIHSIKSVITYLVTAIVFAYFAVGLTRDFTLSAFGWYMLKVCFLVFRGIKSYYTSFLEVYEKGTTRLTTQKLLLDYFQKD